MSRLIIVESPSKARTLARFLGSEYIVLASMGHVRDLPKSKMGVDVDAGFTPQYELIKGKEKQIRDLRAAVKKASSTLLAADPDREGEAIAWHLAEALGLNNPDRIVFHEITKLAVDAALAHPRKIDRSLVSAQEARRVIDRLVGYRLSPLLWRKVRAGLSAGRVQSVAVRLVVDRETEIDAFVPVESWTIDALLAKDGSNPFSARLVGRRGDTDAAEREKLELGTGAEAAEVIAALGLDAKGAVTERTPAFVVRSIDVKETTRRPLPPHTTSTLQQDASSRLRMSPKRTMSIAQELYEGVELGSAGSTGLITYMRTDSIRISDAARDDAAKHITAAFGKDYVGTGAVRRKAAVNVQDAHEAIRPTDVNRTPDSVGSSLSPGQLKVYDLIWRRFVASQMSPAKYLNTAAMIDAADYVFRASGSLITFEGFQKVWKRDEEKDKDLTLPALAEREELRCLEIAAEQHFTQPPPRYTEATLIKELEERGIGRPSTYAATIEVIQERQYVRQLERRLHPTELGKTVDAVLRQNFPDIVDVAFTADLEKRLDSVEEGTRAYEPTVREWYEPFAATLERAERSMERVRVPARETGEECPECEIGRLVVREGKFGEFVGCSRFPDCKYIKDRKTAEALATGEMCPRCGKPLVTRQGRRGPFVGCSGYPSCTYIKDDRTPATAETEGAEPEELGVCPQCAKPLRRRSGRRGTFVGCTGYPDCKYIQPGAPGARPAGPAPEPTGEDCPECSKPLVTRRGRYGPFVSCSGYPACKYRPPKVAVG
ncbi:MAG: type I DNA topoisomerase [Candidatus Dormibacteria bacterium]